MALAHGKIVSLIWAGCVEGGSGGSGSGGVPVVLVMVVVEDWKFEQILSYKETKMLQSFWNFLLTKAVQNVPKQSK